MDDNRRYAPMLSAVAWLNVAYYVLPAIGLLAILAAFDIPTAYWLPMLVIYAIGVISHSFGYGIQAVCVQIKVCTEWLAKDLKAQRSDHDSN